MLFLISLIRCKIEQTLYFIY